MRKAPLAPLPIVEPFGRVHIDHVGPVPKTPQGHRHLLVVVDSTTLWAEAFPSESTTAEETASILYREIICRYGAMKAIETDGGPAFRNKLMTELCNLLKTKHIDVGENDCNRTFRVHLTDHVISRMRRNSYVF